MLEDVGFLTDWSKVLETPVIRLDLLHTFAEVLETMAVLANPELSESYRLVPFDLFPTPDLLGKRGEIHKQIGDSTSFERHPGPDFVDLLSTICKLGVDVTPERQIDLFPVSQEYLSPGKTCACPVSRNRSETWILCLLPHSKSLADTLQ